MAAFGAGYLADATHLRRRERRRHLDNAVAAGLPSAALLTPEAPLEVLLARNAGRPPDERVPEPVLARQHHRRSSLDAERLLGEGFDVVLDL